mgnify:CR=1 FL=1
MKTFLFTAFSPIFTVSYLMPFLSMYNQLPYKRAGSLCRVTVIPVFHAPIGLSEKLFKHVEAIHERFEVKLLYLNMISRLVGIHEVCMTVWLPPPLHQSSYISSIPTACCSWLAAFSLLPAIALKSDVQTVRRDEKTTA